MFFTDGLIFAHLQVPLIKLADFGWAAIARGPVCEVFCGHVPLTSLWTFDVQPAETESHKHARLSPEKDTRGYFA